MLEPSKERFCNILLKVNARIVSDDLFANLIRESLIPDAKHAQSHTVVEKFHFQWLICRNPWSCVQSDGVPRSLYARIGHAVVLQKLTHRVCAIDFEAVARATELFEQAQIMESRTNKQKFDVKFLPGLAPKLISPE